jgi:tetratricopeptide (TPR) repeat protein
MTGHRLAFGLAVILGVASGASAEPRWTVVHTESMIVMGDQSANTLRDVALELEQFRAVLGLLSSNGKPAPTAPTRVYVFGTRKAFEPFVPLHNGKPVQVGGFFQRNGDTNTIALSTEGFADDATVVFHEYSHLLVGTAVRSVPVWLNEGLAEYFSTFRLKAGGKSANIGVAIGPHVQLLRQRFLPLSQLLTVDQSSDLYNEGERRSIFYAESWALTHFLMTELPSGQSLLNQYAAAIAAGGQPEEVFTATFGMTPAAFEPKLRNYLRGLSFKAWAYTFDERVQQAAPAIPPKVLAPAEADAWLGDLLLRIRRTGDAAKRIEGAAVAAPDNAAAQLMLARLRLAQDRADEAWPPLEAALKLGVDDVDIQYRAGVTALEYLDQATSARQVDLVQRAYDALKKAAASNPGSPDTMAWFAYASMRQRSWDEGALAIARAIQLAPGRTEFRIRQADIMILRGSPEVARPMLQDIIARSGDKTTVDSARRRLETLDQYAVPVTSTTPSTSTATPGERPSPARRTAPRMRLDLRRVQAGEQRAFGRLTSVECTAGRVQFHVNVDGHDFVTAASGFASVDLLQYTESKESTLQCGARTARPIRYSSHGASTNRMSGQAK